MELAHLIAYSNENIVKFLNLNYNACIFTYGLIGKAVIMLKSIGQLGSGKSHFF